MFQLLQAFILLPLAAFLVVMVLPRKKEKLISGTAIGAAALHAMGSLGFTVYWLLNKHEALNSKHVVLYKSDTFEFFIDFYFDAATAVYAVLGGFITLLVSIFSRFYMHRDGGFKRFFATVLLFFVGYNLVIFGGNFETLFIGWELLGFCSFLLIAFYRDRYLPVKNGLKVISVYRLGDVCLMLAMWMCHHLFHENITFSQFNDAGFISGHLAGNSTLFIFTAIMVIIAAAAKSAMLPFSSWLPRAMEGPTTSSAVFYGSLSVHLGAFLLIRTYPFWESIPLVKALVIGLGIATSLVAASITRVQPTVKTQIAYASITQMGLIFIEVALGLHILALVHFAGNALLRTYQLLVSPSVLSYRIHDMFFNYKKKAATGAGAQKISGALYILGIKEWNLDRFQYRILWNPFKWVGKKLHFLTGRAGMVILALIFGMGLFSFSIEEQIPREVDDALAVFFSILGLLLVLKAFSHRGSAVNAWFSIIAAQGFITLSVAINDFMPPHQVFIYLGGIVAAALIGYGCLHYIRRIDNDVALNRFHGYSYEKPLTAFLFLVCCLALLGFPFTPTFLGIDLLFTHIHKHQVILLISTALSFIFIELAILRIYARVFLGQHKKHSHPIAYRSS